MIYVRVHSGSLAQSTWPSIGLSMGGFSEIRDSVLLQRLVAFEFMLVYGRSMIFHSFLYVFFTICISYDIVGPIRVCDWEARGKLAGVSLISSKKGKQVSEIPSFRKKVTVCQSSSIYLETFLFISLKVLCNNSFHHSNPCYNPWCV